MLAVIFSFPADPLGLKLVNFSVKSPAMRDNLPDYMIVLPIFIFDNC